MNELRPLGSTGLSCNPLGFGCYRVQDGIETHEKALLAYLARGGNLIDTSANYGDGLSEILVGKILKQYERNKIIVVTKGGYIQGQNMTLARERRFPDVVEYGDDLWHCIHPEFLQTQIDRSLTRMNIAYADVYLLHNPEYYINDQAQFGPLGEAIHGEFYRRVKLAFEFLESQVQKGFIRFYGVSSNNFGFHEKDLARTSVSRCWQIACEISPDHHFRVIQLPMNLYESGGALFPTNDGKTALAFCADKNIGVLLNRPLNAFYDSRMIRLADFLKPGDTRPGEEMLESILGPLRESEHEFSFKFGGEAFGSEHEGLAAYLRFIATDLSSREYWKSVTEKYVVPPVTHWLRTQSHLFGEMDGWETWRNLYVQNVNETLENIEKFLSLGEQKQSDRVRDMLVRCGYPESTESLSRVSLSLLAQVEGVSCVLNGMRSEIYVNDAMGAADLPAVNSIEILGKFQELIDQ